MGGVTAFEYFLYVVGFSLLGIFLFLAVCLLKKRRRGPITYVADRYVQDPHIDYIPPQNSYSLGKIATPVTAGADTEVEAPNQQERERT